MLKLIPKKKFISSFYSLVLVAAVNDITARDEQFQQYLNTGKISSDNNLDYYSASQVENIPPPVYTSPTTKTPSESVVGTSKTSTLGSISNELFSNSCASPTDEFVDINDMEFIKNNQQCQSNKNVIMRRSRRRKLTKRKDDACMCHDLNIFIHKSFIFLLNLNYYFPFFLVLVADKFVPSRALATLPTSYLYFETVSNLEANRSSKFSVKPFHIYPLCIQVSA